MWFVNPSPLLQEVDDKFEMESLSSEPDGVHITAGIRLQSHSQSVESTTMLFSSR